MSSVATVLGLVFTILSFTATPGDPAGWNAFYESMVPVGESGNWNLLVKVVAPVVLVSGLWYLGEQVLARRKFERLINEEKKSALRDNLDELEETAGKLPKRYRNRLDDKIDSFTSKR